MFLYLFVRSYSQPHLFFHALRAIIFLPYWSISNLLVLPSNGCIRVYYAMKVVLKKSRRTEQKEQLTIPYFQAPCVLHWLFLTCVRSIIFVWFQWKIRRLLRQKYFTRSLKRWKYFHQISPILKWWKYLEHIKVSLRRFSLYFNSWWRYLVSYCWKKKLY